MAYNRGGHFILLGRARGLLPQPDTGDGQYTLVPVNCYHTNVISRLLGKISQSFMERIYEYCQIVCQQTVQNIIQHSSKSQDQILVCINTVFWAFGKLGGKWKFSIIPSSWESLICLVMKTHYNTRRSQLSLRRIAITSQIKPMQKCQKLQGLSSKVSQLHRVTC